MSSHSTTDNLVTAIENKLKASPSVDSILFKSGGAVCPAGKSIWDALGDGTVSILSNYNLLTHVTYGLSAIKTLIDTTNAYVDEVESLLKNGTYGLSQITSDIASTASVTQDKVDDVDTVVDAIKVVTDKIPRLVSHMDFWSDNDDDITLTTVATADYALPNIVVAGIPTGATIIRVIAMLKIALIRDTSGVDNAINGVTALKVDADPAYGSLVTAIDIPDNSWSVDVSTSPDRGGDVMIGDNDVSAEITGNATFYARLENICCDGNNLLLKDAAWGIRVYFTV